MRVHDLICEGNIEEIDRGGSPPTFDDLEVIGSGAQAVVYRSTKVNRVVKVLHIKDKNDGVYRYIDMVMDHQDNEFFPKIFFAAIYKDKRYSSNDSGYQFVIEMEKLVPFNGRKAKAMHMLEPLLKQLGITLETAYEMMGDYIEDMGIAPTSSSTEEAELKFQNKIMSGELRRLFGTPEGRKLLISNTTNDDLREALTLTGGIIDANVHGNSRYYDQADLHDENIMVRLTINIPQLVVVDPIITLYSMNY